MGKKLSERDSANDISFTLLINGKEVTPDNRIIKIKVVKELNKVASADIILLEDQTSGNGFGWSNGDVFIPGNTIEILAGYGEKKDVIFKGILIKHRLKIKSGQAYLMVHARDKAVKLTVGRNSRIYFDVTDKDLLSQLIARHPMEADIEQTTIKHKQPIQFNVTDWEYIRSRAYANGKICITDNGCLRIKSPDVEQEPAAIISYGKNLYEFDAEMDARNQFKNITGYGWDSADQSVIEAEAKKSVVALNGNINHDDLSGVIDLYNLELRMGTEDRESLQARTDAQDLFQKLAKIRGKIKISGSAQVAPDTTLLLEGLSERFNGKIYISGIRHEISKEKWVTQVKFGLDLKNPAHRVNPGNTAEHSLFPAIQGLHIGIVDELEDGENEKIRVKLPLVEWGGKGIWARRATLDAGENRGSFFLPEIGDEVIVGFIDNNPQEAVILGMLPGEMKPSPLVASNDNHKKGFFSRSGIQFIFNDEKQSVTIKTPAGREILMNDYENFLSLKDSFGNEILLNDKGIDINSKNNISIQAGGDIHLSGMNTSIKAQAHAKMNGGAGTEISSSGSTTIKSSIVKIN